MPFLDDIPIKGCPEEVKDELIGPNRCQSFVAAHISDYKKILQRRESAQLTFSGKKSAFGQSEILVVGHLCEPYCRKPSPVKVEAISAMKEEWGSVSEVQRFLGACTIYHIWIPHYPHLAEPLYRLLKKGQKFKWGTEHIGVVRKLKDKLTVAPALRKSIYKAETPAYVTMDTIPTRIGWVVNQEDKDGIYSR